MKKIYHLLFALICFAATSAHATNYTVELSGFSYAPPVVNAVVGDQITIEANFNHPLVEVSESTWNNNQDQMLQSGFGNHTSDFTFTVTTAGTIYYVCENHVTNFQMKGLINGSAYLLGGVISFGGRNKSRWTRVIWSIFFQKNC